MNIGYFLGPAGSGKSHMTGALFEWMNNSELDVITLNLDPAVVRLPYAPSIDVRDHVSHEDVVDDYELGPNGAIIASLDQVALKIDAIKEELQEFGAEYVLIDLPGQLEAFAYRSSGPLILSEIGRENTIAGLFLMDPLLTNTASSFISVLLLGQSINYRLNTSMKFVISKGDILNEERLDRIHEWVENPAFLMEDLSLETRILNAQMARRMAELLMADDALQEFPVISSETGHNIDMAFAEFQRIWNSADIL
jgi:hypothetical protein